MGNLSCPILPPKGPDLTEVVVAGVGLTGAPWLQFSPLQVLCAALLATN